MQGGHKRKNASLSIYQVELYLFFFFNGTLWFFYILVSPEEWTSQLHQSLPGECLRFSFSVHFDAPFFTQACPVSLHFHFNGGGNSKWPWCLEIKCLLQTSLLSLSAWTPVPVCSFPTLIQAFPSCSVILTGAPPWCPWALPGLTWSIAVVSPWSAWHWAAWRGVCQFFKDFSQSFLPPSAGDHRTGPSLSFLFMFSCSSHS